MIIFENPGILDPRLISTFGANVKETDNPIGYFGTGLKYALAVLARLGAHVEIQLGLDTKFLSTKFETIRGKQFGMVCLDEVPLGFTTELGKNWKPWMAFRELHCNALDEHGRTFSANYLAPSADTTRILVECPEINAVYAERRKWFLEDEPDFKTDEVEIIFRPSELLFYKGIAIHALESPARFTYNILSNQELTEDRTLASTWNVAYIIGRLVTYDHPKIIEMLTTLAQTDFEASNNYFSFNHASPALAQRVMELYKAGRPIDDGVKQACAKTMPEAFERPPVPASDLQKKTINKALSFLSRAGYPIDQEIEIYETLGRGVLGTIKGSVICLSHECLSMGTKCVAGTILEEHLHITEDLQDTTRRMQNHLIDFCITLMEEKLGEPL